MENIVKCGIYRHYKGNEYEVLGMAKHSETLELMVVYKALYGDNDIWVRPAEMWDDLIETESGIVHRFTLIEDEKSEINAITIEDIADAMEGTMDSWNQYLNRETGEIISIPDPDNDYADIDEEDEELFDEIENTDKYVMLPGQYEIHEYDIMKSFAYDRDSEKEQEKLLYALHNRKPYRHFKGEINFLGIDEQYYEYRFRAFCRMAKEWCECNDIPYKYKDMDKKHENA